MTEPGVTSNDAAGTSNDAQDRELEAIHVVLRALAGLDEASRQRAVEYVFRRLGLTRPSVEPASTNSPTPFVIAPEAREGASGAGAQPIRDIRSFKDAKQPRSAIEMAVLVAYYLAELAPASDRKTEIGTDEINKYFKQADFPLPGRPRKTLLDAKAAGYIDSAARGAYKLNPVGHNLIAHGLPAAGNNAAPRRARATAKKAARGRKKSRR